MQLAVRLSFVSGGMMTDLLEDGALQRWRREPTRFITEVLVNPETGRPFILMPWQKRFIEHAFQTDESGRLVHSEWLAATPKKTGKTEFAEMLLTTTVLVFGGPYAEGYCIANDLEQAQGRVFAAVRRVVEASPYLANEAQVTANRIAFPSTGASITAIASDYAGAAGAHPVISCFDEAWAYTSERSRRLWDEMCVVPTRKISCRLTTTYAGFEGESELLEQLYHRGLAQPEIGPDLHSGDGLLMYWTHQVQAPWQTEAWVETMRHSLRPNAFLRMIENRFVSSEETFVPLEAWEACCTGRPIPADKSLKVWVGIDASVKRDSTGIAVCTWDRGAKKAVLVHHRIFQPSAADPINFEQDIEDTILGIKSRYNLNAVFYDPYQMAAVAQRLQRLNVKMIEYPQSVGNLTAASQNLYELITSQGLVAYPDPDIRLAVQRCVALETSRGWRITKEKASHKIDIVVALAMAALAAVREGEVPSIRWGTIDFAVTGAVTWHDDDEPLPPRIRIVQVSEAEAIEQKAKGIW